MTYRYMQKRLREARRVEETLTLASQIWLAGLGALVRAQQEGRDYFDRLVECGEVMEAVEDDGLRELKQLARRVLAGSSQDRPDTPTPEDIQSLAEAIQNLNLDLRLRELDMR